MKRVAIFGNYSLAKAVAVRLIEKGAEIICLCNDVENDNKYGEGIQQFAKQHKLTLVIGNVTDHIRAASLWKPSFAVSAGYKAKIPVKELAYSVYGIHFGGLVGNDAIRGKNSSIWYRLRKAEYGKMVLYKMTDDVIDIGVPIAEKQCLLGNIEDDINYEKSMIPELIDGIFEFEKQQTDLYPALHFGSYFPGASIRKFSTKYLTSHEQKMFEAVGFSPDDSAVTVNAEPLDESALLYSFSKQEEGIPVIYLHGFASSLPSDKLVKLASFLDDIIIYAPEIKGISRKFCDGTQKPDDLVKQLKHILKKFSHKKPIIIASSIASLILSDLKLDATLARAVIFLTPMYNLLENDLDPAITQYSNATEKNAGIISLERPYYKDCMISSEFLDYLTPLRLIPQLVRLDIPYKIILAQTDDIVHSSCFREKCIEEGIHINDVNIFAGDHSFSSIFQLYVLACYIKMGIGASSR